MKSSCLILHAGALGDCVLTLHIAMAMRRAGHIVTVAARSPIAAWAARRGMIDESISLDRLSPMLWENDKQSHEHGSVASSLLKNSNRIISFLGGVDETVAKRLTELCGPEHVIHIDPRPSEKTLREGTHVTKQWIQEINRQGLDFKLETSDTDTSPHHHITKSPNFIVHPGSGGLAKCCPLDAVEALMREVLANGWRGCWMIGPDEAERDGAEFQQRLERTAPVFFEESVQSAADIVAASDAFIGNDAGMTHVAALAGINTVALFGPTDPRVWRPPLTNCSVFRFPSLHEPEAQWVQTVIGLIAKNASIDFEL